MLTSKQLKIFGLFGKNTFKEYTFTELKSLSKERSHSVLQNAISKFLEEELITERKIGTSKLYKIRHDTSKVHDYLSIYNKEKLPKIVKNSILYVKEELDKSDLFYALVIFGSHADGSFTKESDLDIAVFISNETKKKRMEISLRAAANKTIIDIDAHVITEHEFQEMLRADYENLGKQIARKNLPVFNTSTFYRMLIRSGGHGIDSLS